MLRWKRVLLGVTGGIAAYKAADLTSKLVKLGAEVRVALTAHATEFVAPLTFEALSGNAVIVDMFSPQHEGQMSHIDVARRVDAVVIAPCTANMIGKLAHGIADDWLSTAVLATRAPVLICPAMNTRMFENSVVQENLSRLKKHDFHVAPTEYGDLACGERGSGRLVEVEQILEMIHLILAPKDLAGLRVLVTAGPTREHLDPVRFISNPSSGKMGYACARVAARRGAEVVLVSGPSRLTPPVGVRTIKVVSAEEMLQACLEHFPDCGVVIKAAGVVDYGPQEESVQKIKKAGRQSLSLELALTPDILRTLSQKKKDQILVGFAAETEKIIEYARVKMEAKNLDLIVANDVALKGAGFETDTNIVKILQPEGPTQELPLLTKEEVAEIILDRVLDILRRRGAKTK